MRKICLVQYWAGCPQTPNSKWKRFLAIIQHCAECGWRTYLVWSKMPADPQLTEPFIQAGCKIILEPRARSNFDIGCIWRTYKLLKRLKCDVFHCHNVHTSPLVGAMLAGVPVRIWSKLAMSPYYAQGIEPEWWHRFAPSIRVSSLCAHRILSLSKAVRDEFVSRGGSLSKSLIVPAPIEFERFANASGNGIRKGLGLEKDSFMITSVGHAVPVKGWDILIQAFAKVAKQYPNVTLVLVGSKSAPNEITFYENLKRIVRTQGLTSRVHFLGQRSDVPEILMASDVFALPSRSEGQSLALVEAMASGRPCVASRTGGISDVVVHGKNALLFERENVDELAERLKALITSRSLRVKLGLEAQIRARDFCMKTYVDTIVSCYQSLM